VIIAFLAGSSGGEKFLNAVNQEHGLTGLLSEGGYYVLGTVFFALMGLILYRVAIKKTPA
jgi:hypothetical protein